MIDNTYDYERAFAIVLDKVIFLENFYETNATFSQPHNRTCANLCCRIKDEMFNALNQSIKSMAVKQEG